MKERASVRMSKRVSVKPQNGAPGTKKEEEEKKKSEGKKSNVDCPSQSLSKRKYYLYEWKKNRIKYNALTRRHANFVFFKTKTGASGSRISVRPSARRSMHVANQLTSLVTEIAKIETAVTAAHAAREEAEQRLYDICVEKLLVDGVLKKVVQSLFTVESSLRAVCDIQIG